MLEELIIWFGIILICCLGAYLYLRPFGAAAKIKAFYSAYPIIRLAGEKQLTSRVGYVRLLGIVITALGVGLLILGIIRLFSG